ncbi:hypothetical protein ACOSP7_003335 [Xanthoceras sorbifolium]
MTSAPQKRDKDKYCRFHRDHDHDTSKCFQLKDHIENLVSDEHLKEFIQRKEGNDNPRQARGPPEKRSERPKGPTRPPHPRSPKRPDQRSERPKASPINTIHGGHGMGISNREREIEIREASDRR